MCGLAGILSAYSPDPDVLRAMANRITHRGPNDSGLWYDPPSGVGLAHRRLAVVDLSLSGHQPMISSNGRWVITYNGEIYNHLELRGRLEAERVVPGGGWRGHSDTESLLEAIAAFGIENTLASSVGMFAFALWDRQERRLHLVRDRFGEKPLYYGWAGADFVFASELKALRAHPAFKEEIDRTALDVFLSRGYIPAPRSIYCDVYKLPPASILTICAQKRKPVIRSYWSYREVVERGLADPLTDENEALEMTGAALGRAIADQTVADVPVGAFLSGGIDSSTVVALYQQHSRQPVRTFSIGFEDKAFNEANYARAVARHFGTIHNELIVTASDAREIIPLLPQIYDEPFADHSQIPTYLVSRFARSKVTVALTGDGGDELFGGYYRHYRLPEIWRSISRVPGVVRRAGRPLSWIPVSTWAGLLAQVSGPRGTSQGSKIHRALRMATTVGSFEQFCEPELDRWYGKRSPILESPTRASGFDFSVEGADAERMMYCDAVSYLPDNILCKVDRASMAVSLETRVPFLDHRVAAVAARVPLKFKIQGGSGKNILRRLLSQYMPVGLVDRPKAGFGVPVGDWIRGPLRPWAESLLDEKRLADEGWLAPLIVRAAWRRHLAGQEDLSPALWPILMFQQWLESQ